MTNDENDGIYTPSASAAHEEPTAHAANDDYDNADLRTDASQTLSAPINVTQQRSSNTEVTDESAGPTAINTKTTTLEVSITSTEFKGHDRDSSDTNGEKNDISPRKGVGVADESDFGQQDEESGGNLWKIAGEAPLPVSAHFAATKGESTLEGPGIRKKQQPTNSLLAKTKTNNRLMSAATASAVETKAVNDASMESQPTQQDDALMAELSTKRSRVVPLLIGGVLGLFLGFFGNLYTQTSCHFATVLIQVGEYQSPFKFHYGMWKYSPIDSVFAGYSYCTHYSNANSSADIPNVPRIFNAVGLAAGFLGLFVLWTYLIVGATRQWAWKMAVLLFGLASVTNFMTYLFFAGQVCRSNSCSFGPSAYAVLLTTAVWALLAYILKENTPLCILFDELAAKTSRSVQARTNGTAFGEGLLSDRDIHRRAKSVLNLLPLRGARKNIPSLSSFSKRQKQSAYLHTSSQSSSGGSTSGGGAGGASFSDTTDTRSDAQHSSGAAKPFQSNGREGGGDYQPPNVPDIV